jgi:hypothetical protein
MFFPINLITDLFSTPFIKALYCEITGKHNLEIGKRYTPRDDGNPFIENKHIMEILNIKKGWVNYKDITLTSLGQNQSMKIDSFIYCYEEEG